MARPKVANEQNVRLWTKQEVGALLCVSERTVERMIDRGQIEAVHLGRAVRVRTQSVLALVEASRLDPSRPD
jgi:excisionase family DNA binding protein